MPKREKVREMFDGIAGSYDKFNHIMSLNIDKCWRRRAIRKFLTSDKPQEILDLACGTGDFSLATARLMRPDSHITAIDLSPGMLDIMRQKVAQAHLEDRISINTGDGEKLDFQDRTFDAVTIAFGIRNFENREAGLREIRRVLKDGGKIVILELSVPENAFIRRIYNIYFTKIMPVIGRKISGDGKAYSYLPASVLGFPDKDKWMRTMQECGFSAVTHKSLSLGICRLYTGERQDKESLEQLQ